MGLEGTITNRGQLAASYAVRGTHVPPYAIPWSLDGAFLLAAGKLQFNGGGWNNGIGSWAGGFLTPASSGWFQVYVDVASILAGPPTSAFNIAPVALRVGSATDPQPTTPFPTSSFPLALVQSSGPSIRTLLDMRPLPAVTFETVNGVRVFEAIAGDPGLRSGFISNFDIPQATLPASTNLVAKYPEAISQDVPVFAVDAQNYALSTPVVQYRLGPYGAANGRVDALGADYFSPGYLTGGTAGPNFLPASVLWGINTGTNQLTSWPNGTTQPASTQLLFRQDYDSHGFVTLLLDLRPAAAF